MKQIHMGNYVDDQMSPTGYSILIQRFFEETELSHSNMQIRNRITQLKQKYAFIKDITCTRTGLGTRSDGWPLAFVEWWDDATRV